MSYVKDIILRRKKQNCMMVLTDWATPSVPETGRKSKQASNRGGWWMLDLEHRPYWPGSMCHLSWRYYRFQHRFHYRAVTPADHTWEKAVSFSGCPHQRARYDRHSVPEALDMARPVRQDLQATLGFLGNPLLIPSLLFNLEPLQGSTVNKTARITDVI